MNNLSNVNKFEHYINDLEIAEPRSSAQFIKWYESKLQLIRDELEGKRIDSKQMLLHEGIAKIFYEELYPLYKLIQQKEKQWTEISIVPVVGNQNYDVLVNTSAKNVPKYIEITNADRHYDEHLRMQYFLKHGSVDMSADVSKKNGTIYVDDDGGLDLYSDLSSKKQEQIVKAIKSKELSDCRPDNTALLVFFDDSIVFSNDEERHELDIVLKTVRLNRFSHLYVVGSVKGYLFEGVYV